VLYKNFRIPPVYGNSEVWRESPPRPFIQPGHTMVVEGQVSRAGRETLTAGVIAGQAALPERKTRAPFMTFPATARIWEGSAPIVVRLPKFLRFRKSGDEFIVNWMRIARAGPGSHFWRRVWQSKRGTAGLCPSLEMLPVL